MLARFAPFRLPVATVGAALLVCCALTLAGCQSGYTPDPGTAAMLARGDTSRARVDLALRADDPKAGRERLLYEVQAMHAALLDGLPEAASRRVEYVFDTLRTQGLNANNSPDLFLVNEQGVRFWKGEPYEQAVALSLVSIADMMTGRWGNARAAAIESLQRLNADDDSRTAEFLLGRLLAGVANRQMGRAQEAAEHFDAARAASDRVRALADELEHGTYDALLVIEAGRSPARTASGGDGTEVVFRDRSPSNAKGLRVSDASGSALWPWTTDLNAMARDHRWTGLDAGRRSKAAAGNVLTAGGIAVAASSDDSAAQLAGAGAALIGLIAKSNARADSRYDDLLPQRFYLAPIKMGIEPPALSVESSGSSLRPVGLRPNEDGSLAVRLLRWPETSTTGWAESGQVFYANDVTGPLETPTLPWVLGGRCVRTPTRALMAEYRRAGLAESVSYEDLMELYRAESIDLLQGRDQSQARGHVLEGGSTLFTPQGGSIGFTRLFGQFHTTYTPTSTQGRALSLLVSPTITTTEESP